MLQRWLGQNACDEIKARLFVLYHSRRHIDDVGVGSSYLRVNSHPPTARDTRKSSRPMSNEAACVMGFRLGFLQLETVTNQQLLFTGDGIGRAI